MTMRTGSSMKKKILKLWFLCGITFITSPLTAETETVGGYTWTYRTFGDTVEIFKADSSGHNGTTAISPLPIGAVTIPHSLGGYPVTSIGENAFSGCSGMTSVTIPDHITYIGYGAFFGCSGLTGVYISDLSAWYEIFWGDSSSNPLCYAHNLYINGSLVKELVIPDGVTSIGNYAFYGCRGLTSVSIPNSVTSIGDYAFEGCDASLYNTNSIPEVKLLDGWILGTTGSLSGHLNITGVRGIGDCAFYACSNLTSLAISDTVTNVGWGAFSGCCGLKSVKLPAKLSNIKGATFHGCSGLTSMTIPNSVTNIGSQAFEDCYGLTSMTIPSSVTDIGDYAFAYCYGLTSMKVPNSVARVGMYAFVGCSGLSDAGGFFCSDNVLYYYSGTDANVVIPAGVTSIGDCVFFDRDDLTSVTIPDGVTRIGAGAFAGCSGLTAVVMPKSVKIIGDSAFEVCESMTNVTIPDSVTSIGKYAFNGCGGLKNVTIPDSVTNIGDGAFGGCSGLTSMTIPDSVTSIGYGMFGDCERLTGVTIPSSVTSIGDYAFSRCVSLTGMTIPDSVTSIGHSAFEGCTGLTNMRIPNSVTNIGFCAFYGCSRLASVTMPESVTSINVAMFFNCSNLTSVTVGKDVTNICTYAFFGCVGLASMAIPNRVESIDECAFFGCRGLTSVAIPVNVTSIGDNAFNGTALSKIHVEVGDTARVKAMLESSGFDVSGVTFVEDVAPGFDAIEATDVIAPYEVPKAVTLHGVVYDDGKVVGSVELKLGKVNDKKKTSKVSGTVTTLDGKKHAIKAFNLAGVDATSPMDVSLEVRDFGTMEITIGGTQFAGSMGKYHVQSAVVGGNWTKGDSKVYVVATSASLPEGALEELLPYGEPVTASGGKWKFAKAAGVKWAKPKKGAALPEIYDEASGKGLLVDTSGDKTNLSAMKLTYTPKKGTFKGSFKVYALEGEGKARKLKKYTVKVSGVVVGGVGYGTATCKKPALNWTVTVK